MSTLQDLAYNNIVYERGLPINKIIKEKEVKEYRILEKDGTSTKLGKCIKHTFEMEHYSGILVPHNHFEFEIHFRISECSAGGSITTFFGSFIL
jgi:hypothetical protein